jgi:hypothetical protein
MPRDAPVTTATSGFIDCRLPFRNRDHDRRLWIEKSMIGAIAIGDRRTSFLFIICNRQSPIVIDRNRSRSTTIDVKNLKRAKKERKKSEKKEQSAHKEKVIF